MTSLARADYGSEPHISGVRFAADQLIFDLVGGATLSAPVEWFPRLARATPEQRANWELIGAGYGVHWPDVDEDLRAASLLNGEPDIATRERQAAWRSPLMAD